MRALRARGVQAGDGVALLCSNRPEFVETVVGRRGAPGLRLTTVNWHLTADEAGYIVDDCEATAFVADARFAARRARARPSSRRVCARRIAVGGDDRRLRGLGRRARAGSRAIDIDDPVVGSTMLYTSGTTGRPKGVRRPPDPRGALDVAPAHAVPTPTRHVHLCTGPLYHAAPLAFSLAAPAAIGVPIVMMDGWSAERDARAHRAAPHHAHAHGADDVPPAALAARRREGALRHLVAHLHPPRRGAVPGRGEAAADGLARPDRVGVLRGDRGRGHARRAPTSGCASRARSARSTRPTTSASSTTTGRASAPGEIGTVYLRGARRRPLRVLQGAREDRRRVPRRRTSPSATSATSTTTATSSSPIAARTSSSAGA